MSNETDQEIISMITLNEEETLVLADAVIGVKDDLKEQLNDNTEYGSFEGERDRLRQYIKVLDQLEIQLKHDLGGAIVKGTLPF